MNNGHSNKNSKGNGSNSSKPKEEKGAEQPYLSNPSRDYSSDPSKYAYPPKNGNQKPKENYTTEPGDRTRVGEEPKLESHQFQQEDYQRKYAREDVKEERENMRKGFSKSSRYDKEQVITYVVLAIGLLIFFFNEVLGGFMIGAVAGYHFSEEIVYYIRHFHDLVKGSNPLRTLAFGVSLFALFIAIPSLFIGAVLVAVFKQFLIGRSH